MDRDALVGIAVAGGILVLVAAVFLYGTQIAPDPYTDYEIAWARDQTAPASRSGELNAGGTQGFEFDVAGPNLTRVLVTLEWDDGIGPNNDIMTFVVADPSGGSHPATVDATGHIALAINVASVPDADTVRALTQGEAREIAEEEYTNATGSGKWTVTVELREAPGVQSAVGNVETQADGVQAFNVTFTYQTYRAQWSDEEA